MKFETINGTLCRMVEPEPKESPIDPIERPLRNLILEAKEKGVNIRTWYQDLIFTPESLTSYLGNGKYRWWNIGNWELTKRKANMPMPEPEPALKVGDWVKYDIDSYLRVIETPGRERTLCKTLSGVIVYPYTSCLTKVSPSEVRVKVVLEGTVSQDSILDKASCFSLHTDRSEHIISLSEIEDSELVESLLKAQEEEK